jgi:hypothetical protein
MPLHNVEPAIRLGNLGHQARPVVPTFVATGRHCMQRLDERFKDGSDIGRGPSFAVGGTVVRHPRTFDPIKQGAFNPAGPDSAGQTLDHARPPHGLSGLL